MGSKTSSQQNQQSTTAADPRAISDYNQTIARAKQVSQTPYQAYSGELTAGVNAQENTATSAMNGLGATANGYYSSAAQQSGLGAAAVNPTAVNGAAISQYESPYQQDVINSTMAQIDQQNKIQQNQQTSNAIGAGAFGGDRAGLASAALSGQQALATNATLANLNNQNYSQALGEANTQQSVGLGAAQANRTALQQNAETLAGIGSAATSSGLGVANAQLGAGALQQQTSQAADTANYGQFEQKQAYPFQTEQYLANIVEGIAPNYGSSSTGQTTTQTSPLNSIIGGTVALGGLLSDRRAKESIKKIGRTFDGQTIYSFRYKGEDTTHVGLMAQDVEKKHPGAVGSLGDLKTVDYAEATRKAASKGHFAAGGSTGEIGMTPYSDATGYVPVANAVGQSHMLTAPQQQQSAPSSTSTSSIPNFSQFASAGAGIGNAMGGLGNAASSVGNYLGGGMNSVGMFNFADGGKVVGLGAARARRGYDGGGVVGADDLMFDPNALGSIGQFQSGVGAVPAQQTMTPPPPIPAPTGVAPAAAPSAAPQGLGAASNDNAPVPVAAAPVMTPILGYQGGVAGSSPPPSQGGGLGAINAASPASTDPMGGYLARTRAIESQGDDGADNGVAKGRYQFTPATWSDVAAKHPDLGLTPDGIGDVGQQEKAIRAFTADNSASLTRALGRQPTASELYLAHQQGAGGAIGLLTNPSARASDIVGEKAITMNGGSPDMTAGQFAGMWSSKFNGTSGATGSMPASALGYAGGSGGGVGGGAGLGAANTLGNVSDLSSGVAPAKLSDYFGGMVGGTGTPSAGHSGGVLGLIPGVSDDARMAMMAAGLGMAASTSKSPGVALGQGGLQGIQTYQQSQKLATERALAQSQMANAKSEIATRAGTLGLDTRKENFVESQAQRLMDALKGINSEQKAASSSAAPPMSLPKVGGAPTPTSSPPISSSAPQPSTAASSFDWTKVAPESNPAVLDAQASRYEQAAGSASAVNPEVGAMYGRMATQARSQAAAIRQSGKVTMADGSVGLLPGYTDTEGAIESAKTNARASTEAGYRVREVEPTPGGPSTYTTDAAIINGAKGSGTVGVGAGSPPGSAAGAPPAAVAKQPAFYAAKQDMIAKNETEMVGQFQARQVARQRLQDLQGILQNYQTGAFSEEKADLAAKLSAAGIPVSKGAMDNAQNFQKFTKDATANLFDSVKAMGGRVLVSEIEGLKNANANADLQPGANAAIIGQGLGLLNYEDKHTNDYFAWKQANPNATDTSGFELPWSKANPVKPFVDAARLGTAAKGVAIPAPSDRVSGQAYMTPKGRAVWTGQGWRLATQ